MALKWQSQICSSNVALNGIINIDTERIFTFFPLDISYVLLWTFLACMGSKTFALCYFFFFFWNHLWDFGVVFWAVYLVEMESVALDNSALTHS